MRVTFAGRDDMVSDMLPVLVQHGTYSLPSVGDSVLCLFLPNSNSGFCVGTYYVASETKPLSKDGSQATWLDNPMINSTIGFRAPNSNQKNAPYNFAVVEGQRGGVEYTEIWILVNAWYDYDTKRFKRVNVDNFSFGWQLQGGGTYPGEETIGDFINQGVNLWKANGKKAYAVGDPMRDQTGEDIGVQLPDGTWREYGVMLGWNNHFMCDSYGGMTIGGAGFEIDGAGISPFNRVSLGRFSGKSENPDRPVQEYGYLYNAMLWNTQHGLWNKDEDQLPGYYYGMQSPINYFAHGTFDPWSNRADLDKCEFVFKRLGSFVRPYVENWQSLLRINQDGVTTLASFEELERKTLDINPQAQDFIIIPFPDATWNKSNMEVVFLQGKTDYYDEPLKDREHRWTVEGLRIKLNFTYYRNVKVTIRKLKKTEMEIHPRKGISVDGKSIYKKTTLKVDFLAGSTDFNVNFPDNTWTPDNTVILAVIGKLADGSSRQLTINATITPSGVYGALGSNEYVSAKIVLDRC
ncbi:hypothetical protein [Paenibacillus agilis]|uniref:Uncharacterized protein n=1 Tax=Paenibacillus agilis TaxID=3020863 RepID=A0A559IZK5_9BACL|nr:hypothetical protein [Paenibacillus agilis]TVX93052.1 hypothetical protein FPZ44_08255 [Paenibacillus agilis]